MSSDSVNHPAHYGGDSVYETIRVLEAWDPKLAIGFCWGNAIKYLSRAGKKDPATLAEDLEKASWYADKLAEMVREMVLLEEQDAKEKAREEPTLYWDKDGDLWEHTDRFGGGWHMRWSNGVDYGEPTNQVQVFGTLEELNKGYSPLRPASFVPMEKKDLCTTRITRNS